MNGAISVYGKNLAKACVGKKTGHVVVDRNDIVHLMDEYVATVGALRMYERLFDKFGGTENDVTPNDLMFAYECVADLTNKYWAED